MPMTVWISLLVRECFSGPMMGMPPPTLASKSTSTPLASAACHDLLAVAGEQRLVGGDHALAGVQRSEHDLAGDAGTADELDHDVQRVVGDDVVPVIGALLGRQAKVGEALDRAVGEARKLDVDAGAAA